MNIEVPQNKYNNLTKEKRRALYDLKSDKNILIKSAVRVPRLSFGIGRIILKRLRNNLETKIFIRRCVMILKLL